MYMQTINSKCTSVGSKNYYFYKTNLQLPGQSIEDKWGECFNTYSNAMQQIVATIFKMTLRK